MRGSPQAGHLTLSMISALSLVIAASWTPSRAAELPAHPSVLFITIDTLRADHLGCYGYFRDTSPAIDRFAADGILFEKAVTPMSTTLPAHTSLMTSTLPARHGILANLNIYEQPLDAEGELRTAAQMFRKAGYATAAWVSTMHLGAESGINAGFDRFSGVKDIERRGDRTTERFLAWLDERPAGPFFAWLHYFDPHSPYEAPAPFSEMYATDKQLLKRIDEQAIDEGFHAFALWVNNRYDGEVRYTDGQVGRVLERLKKTGLYDRLLIVLTADHGEGLMQHDRKEHGVVYNEQLYVPLIIKFPAGTGPGPRRVPHLTSLIDVLPTIVETADLPVPTKSFDGVNALVSPRRFALAERSQRISNAENFALTDLDWKYFYRADAPDELFDLNADFVETRNVIGEQPERARKMKARLLEMVQRHRARGSSLRIKDEMSDELRKALKSLGYVD